VRASPRRSEEALAETLDGIYTAKLANPAPPQPVDLSARRADGREQ
jgi:hypothetical protein